jgi:hypothetical protein
MWFRFEVVRYRLAWQVLALSSSQDQAYESAELDAWL